MSGLPAARQTDMTLKGGPIVQGSLTVLIGSQGGKACSVCPGGVTKGSPVNPQLGAKVLLGPEDLDFALPGALPVIWQRQYSSYVNAEHGAACGLLGHGWHQFIDRRTHAAGDVDGKKGKQCVVEIVDADDGADDPRQPAAAAPSRRDWLATAALMTAPGFSPSPLAGEGWGEGAAAVDRSATYRFDRRCPTPPAPPPQGKVGARELPRQPKGRELAWDGPALRS